MPPGTLDATPGPKWGLSRIWRAFSKFLTGLVVYFFYRRQRLLQDLHPVPARRLNLRAALSKT